MVICKKFFFTIFFFRFLCAQEEAIKIFVSEMGEYYHENYLHYSYSVKGALKVISIEKKEEYSKENLVQFFRILLRNGKPDCDADWNEATMNLPLKSKLKCPYCNNIKEENFSYLWYHFSKNHSGYLKK